MEIMIRSLKTGYSSLTYTPKFLKIHIDPMC